MIRHRLLVPLALLAVSLPLSADVTFDLVNDFSASTNPNGVWSYGESSSPSGAFTAYSSNASSAAPVVDFWLNQPFNSGFPNYYPLIRHNASGAPIDDGSGLILPTNMLSLDPSNLLDSVVRFTAPNAGAYSFGGSFQGLQSGASATSSAASIYLDGGASALVSGDIDSNSALPFSFMLNLAAGDVLDFRVNARQDQNGDSTGLALTVRERTEGSVVPEPSYTALLALALAAVSFAKAKR